MMALTHASQPIAERAQAPRAGWRGRSLSDRRPRGALASARHGLLPAFCVAVWLACALPVLAQRATDPAAEALIATDARFHPQIAEGGIVAAQETIAAEVGADILRQGGNAVDAAVAVGFALAVTHPQAGNLGGGGFMLVALAGEKKIVAIDYREMAPLAAARDMFLDAAGAVDTAKARFSHSASGVPGTVAGLLHALERYGALPRKRVMEPAIRLAAEGFPVSRDLAHALAKARDRFASDASSLAYFQHPAGRPFEPGEILRQPDLAKTLVAIRDGGTAGFYSGWVADAIAAEMQAGGGAISREDLATYRVIEREPVRGAFRGFEIASMPPPSSGGAHLLQMLNILEGYDLKGLGHNSADYLHRLIEAARRVYADRAEHMGDPDFHTVPLAWLTSKPYAARLRDGIDLARAGVSMRIAPGKPLAGESEETTHFSVMDREGNAVANTYTLNFAFGNHKSVDGAGFLLNNEMDDFSARPGAPNAYGLIGGEANAIAPRKRPLSSMTPTIVLKDGAPVLATGSPGGSTIITVVLQLLLNVMEFGMNIADASAAPRIHHQWLPDNVISEPGIAIDTLRILDARGFVLPREADGRFQHRILGRANTVARQGRYLLGASDPRALDGAVRGK
jgi:gamma-glutamyltranspeptidase/glutathione hydrolase